MASGQHIKFQLKHIGQFKMGIKWLYIEHQEKQTPTTALIHKLLMQYLINKTKHNYPFFHQNKSPWELFFYFKYNR